MDADADELTGGRPPDVDLVGLPAYLDAAVVFPVLVDEEVELQLEILELVDGDERAALLGIAVLSADDHALFHPPDRRAGRREPGEVLAVEQRPPRAGRTGLSFRAFRLVPVNLDVSRGAAGGDDVGLLVAV